MGKMHTAQNKRVEVMKASSTPGLPDGLFSKPKITIWVKCWRSLEWKMLLYFMTIWKIFWSFGTINSRKV
jgi:hypothetical protein